MAHRILNLQGHVLASDASVSGGVEMSSTSANEDADFGQRVKAMDAWMKSDRYKYTTRPFTAEDVIKLQGTLPLHFTGAKISDKLYCMMPITRPRVPARTPLAPLTLSRWCRWPSTSRPSM